MQFRRLVVAASLLMPFCVFAQSDGRTAEDSLGSGRSPKSETVIGGYGDAVYQRYSELKTSYMNLERLVLFVGHHYGSISFFTEIEVEDAKVSGGEEGGEVAIEQAYLKFNIDQSHYLTAGLFLPRIGILNENHLPNAFNGNERTQVETFIIPSTWRELGVGFYGSMSTLPISYSVAFLNGLNSAAFENGSVIRGGRYEGRNAGANNLAITGSLQWEPDKFKFEVAGYYGGTVSAAVHEADSLRLESGLFGTPVLLGEADVQYESDGFSARLLGTVISIPDAFSINGAYGNNTPKTAYGGYLEIGYDLLHSSKRLNSERLIAFVRYEKLDMNAVVPQNGIRNRALDQHHLIAGFTYLPHPNVAAKADVRFQRDGDNQRRTFLNLGIGFSF